MIYKKKKVNKQEEVFLLILPFFFAVSCHSVPGIIVFLVSHPLGLSHLSVQPSIEMVPSNSSGFFFQNTALSSVDEKLGEEGGTHCVGGPSGMGISYVLLTVAVAEHESEKKDDEQEQTAAEVLPLAVILPAAAAAESKVLRHALEALRLFPGCEEALFAHKISSRTMTAGGGGIRFQWGKNVPTRASTLYHFLVQRCVQPLFLQPGLHPISSSLFPFSPAVEGGREKGKGKKNCVAPKAGADRPSNFTSFSPASDASAMRSHHQEENHGSSVLKPAGESNSRLADTIHSLESSDDCFPVSVVAALKNVLENSKSQEETKEGELKTEDADELMDIISWNQEGVSKMRTIEDIQAEVWNRNAEEIALEALLSSMDTQELLEFSGNPAGLLALHPSIEPPLLQSSSSTGVVGVSLFDTLSPSQLSINHSHKSSNTKNTIETFVRLSSQLEERYNRTIERDDEVKRLQAIGFPGSPKEISTTEENLDEGKKYRCFTCNGYPRMPIFPLSEMIFGNNNESVLPHLGLMMTVRSQSSFAATTSMATTVALKEILNGVKNDEEVKRIAVEIIKASSFLQL